MKKGFTNLMAALVLLLGGAISSNAQTTLSAGDIAFIGLYMDGLATAGDGFTFILLKNIDAGTVIYFTDEGWDATNNAWYGNSNDAHFTWTAPTGGSTVGTIVHIQSITATTYSTTLGEVSSTLNGVWNLSSSGDQMLAYQSNAVRPATPTFIAAVDADYYTSSTYDGIDGWGSSYYATNYVSDLPPGLTNGVNCVALVNASQPTEYDNYKYNGTLTGTTNDIRAAINSYTNWTRNDDGTLDIGASAYSTPNITIPATAPTVTTQAVSSITSTTATGNGNITALGSPNPTQYGVVWSTSTNPTIALTTKTTEGSSSSTGAFTASMTGLSEGTTYYVRAYATNTAGTSYGAEVSFTTQSTPTITWANPADITYGTLLTATQLNATTSVPGIFTYTPALGEKLSAGAAQDLQVSFTPTDAALYLSTSKTVTINVNKATPVITWENPTGITYGTLLSATQLDATADVLGTMVYTPATGAKLNAGTAQDLQVSFTPTDVANYSSATKTVTIDVSKATPVITWESPTGITYETLLSATQLNATSDVAGTMVYTPALGEKLSAGAAQNLKVDFTPTDDTNYNTATKTVTINVNKATPVITWENPTGITYGTLLSTTQLNATSDVAGTMVYTPATGAKLNAGTAQDLQVSFTPTDVANYSSATKTVTIDVSKATPVITWEDPDDISKGMALSATQLNATADVVGSFVYIPDFGTVLSTGANQSLLVEFAPTDTLNYSNETKTVLITVNSTVGISKAKNSAFRVYLNPTVDLLRIDGLTERAVLTITDLNGRVFMNEEIENNQSVSTSSLPKGAYLANILTKGNSHAIMFFKK